MKDRFTLPNKGELTYSGLKKPKEAIFTCSNCSKEYSGSINKDGIITFPDVKCCEGMYTVTVN